VQLSCTRWSHSDRWGRVLTGKERSGEVGDSELQSNDGSCASPPATKGQGEVEGAADTTDR
jgi:hypothetical protein